MELTFYKYQGTGNDFVMIDNRNEIFPKQSTEQIAQLCHRKFGIGADGLILLENEKGVDFKMVYYNADGKESTMCGNGGRCLVAFAKELGIIENKAQFMAVDGLHHATLTKDQICLQMQDVATIHEKPNALFLSTGSPHHVQCVAHLNRFNVVKEGAKLRYGIYGATGSNINFVQQISNSHFEARTYERGVEDETLSCGTGVTAVAIAMHYWGKTEAQNVLISTPGGDLEVSFTSENKKYKHIVLKGPAKLVFKGQLRCS
ncbi:diaminopimelate epimerase [Arenibacter sp. GZD96]|uniref:diaminopimelate epimerase n=1 Tax=Aurantibrevibacter litoralis TaxID=3106030 RepID=UPI002AFDD7A3|nr:diaminopimelate epimerase [Arenibacter sp. GZD-96]MEA1786318.1 diaminopimelate epimerase [Arenibacter sp. GZD-96]